MSIDDFFSENLSSEKMNIVITFDDGYRSNFTYAMPILTRLNLPATFFISSGFVNLSREAESEFIRTKLMAQPSTNQEDKGCLKYEDIERMVDQGFTVGGHTLNHCNLAYLRDRGKLEYEIAEDKIKLERITGRKVDYFAYPFGAHRNPEFDIAEILKQNGYKAAMTTLPGLNLIGANPYTLNREATPASMHIQVFRARALGNYEGVNFLKRCISSISDSKY
ncbi:polysaccharide deacetylase family protein [candidate division KSB1 bacterium]|nr:polysaccharide deacetylase family protein [candidate division KSB1 bacterium]